MILDLYTALAIGALCVLICTSDAMQWFRDTCDSAWEWLGNLVNCTFCTSVWLSLVAAFTINPAADVNYIGLWSLPVLRAGAMCTIANVAVLLIHLSMATVSDESDQD